MSDLPLQRKDSDIPFAGMHRLWPGLCLAVIALAAALRIVAIDIKPPHFDEGINGWFADGMAARGFYDYDPENFHGPLHFYAVYASTRLFGRNLFALRLPAIVASIGCVVAALLFARYLGRGTALLGAFALAVSPAFVFYGRYSIHESWQVLFAMTGTLAVFWIGRPPPKTDEAAGWRLLGCSLAGLACTKETFVLHVGSAVVAAALLWSAGAISVRWEWRLPTGRMGWRGAGVAMFWFALPAVLLFSGFLADPDGITNFFKAFEKWSATGFEEQGGHNKPPLYWLGLMARYEWVMLPGLAAAWLCWFPGDARERWIALTAAGVFLAYSIIPYKTPWCIISILWPFPFVLGSLAGRLDGRKRILAFAVCAALAGATLWPSLRLNFFNHSNPQEPYVYVQTSPEIGRFTGPLLREARADPRKYGLAGTIFLDGSYPLPWILGDFHAVSYYDGGRRPASFAADFLLVERGSVNEVERSFDEDYYRVDFALRDGRPPVVGYFRASVFRNQFGGREPEVKVGGEGSVE